MLIRWVYIKDILIRKLSYKNSIDASKNLISLPSSVNLTDNEIDYIARKIKNFFK